MKKIENPAVPESAIRSVKGLCPIKCAGIGFAILAALDDGRMVRVTFQPGRQIEITEVRSHERL